MPAPCVRELTASPPSSSLCPPNPGPSSLLPKLSKACSKLTQTVCAIRPGVGLSQLTAHRCTLPNPHTRALPVHSTHTATLSHAERQPVSCTPSDIHSSPHKPAVESETHSHVPTRTHTDSAHPPWTPSCFCYSLYFCLALSLCWR